MAAGVAGGAAGAGDLRGGEAILSLAFGAIWLIRRGVVCQIGRAGGGVEQFGGRDGAAGADGRGGRRGADWHRGCNGVGKRWSAVDGGRRKEA